MSMKYVENPNFPKNKVAFTAVSYEAEDIIEALNSAKIGVVPIKPCDDLPTGIASHADLQLLHLGGNKVLTSSCSNDSTMLLNNIGFDVENTDEILTSKYPNDCLLNVAIIGNNIIMNPNAVSEKIIKYIDDNNLNIIGIKQGYTKCSIMTICEDAIITADRKIAEAAEAHDIEVLKIREGGIYLFGYETGFIGGCGGMIEQKILGTSGNLKSIKDYDNIKDFLRNRNIYVENLGGGMLRDIGGIIPLCEEN